MKHVFVIGMGLSDRDLTGAHLEIIRSADLLIGGRRHLAAFKDLASSKQVIDGNVTETLAAIRAAGSDRRVVVLASGDPLLFGIGARIAADIGQDRVAVFPNISSIAAAFARINEPWGDAKIVSLHGRDRKFELLAALKSRASVAVLTDPQQSPAWLARWLIERGAAHVPMAVFEQLGSPQERFGWYSAAQATEKHFGQPNVVLLRPNASEGGSGDDLHFGMPDDAYRHERGLITKAEVRAVTLAKLSLKPGMTLWDLGAGSGAVGIEASILLGSGRIVAVEKEAARVAQIRENARRYAVYNHEVVQASLPEGLKMLPRPDRIFVGGGGRDLAVIVREAVRSLNPGGVLVANTVLVDNLSPVTAVLEAAGMATEMVQIQVSQSKPMPWSMRLKAHSPVWIIRGCRKQKENE